MNRAEYVGYRQTNTYPPTMIYDYYIEKKLGINSPCTYEEFSQAFNMYMMFEGRPFIHYLNLVIAYFDTKFNVCILRNKIGDKVLKIY